MDYNLLVTPKAEELFDQIVYHLIFRLKNKQAAAHLFRSIGIIYDRLEANPFQFPKAKDVNLFRLGYREAVLPDMGYVVIFRIEGTFVYIVGIFHQLEDYSEKVE